jgi:hypothetical protein
VLPLHQGGPCPALSLGTRTNSATNVDARATSAHQVRRRRLGQRAGTGRPPCPPLDIRHDWTVSNSTGTTDGPGNLPARPEAAAGRIPRVADDRTPAPVPAHRSRAGPVRDAGLDGTTIEEIAASAGVSKPVIYEHFGSKEGLYTQVVEYEFRILLADINNALADEAKPRVLVERAALALLTYIEERTDGFRILMRDAPPSQPEGAFPRCSRTSPRALSTSCPTNSPAAGSARPTAPCTRRCSWAWWR